MHHALRSSIGGLESEGLFRVSEVLHALQREGNEGLSAEQHASLEAVIKERVQALIEDLESKQDRELLGLLRVALRCLSAPENEGVFA